MTSAITPEIHRELAVKLFNDVWDLLDKKDRTREEAQRMINAAHASLYHWSLVGEAVNLARGEWQVSRVYSECGRGEPAIHHANNSLQICTQNKIGDFDLAFAYEALARAFMVSGDGLRSNEYKHQATQSSQAISKKEDKDYFLGELGSIKNA
jgi:hypothetical protein